MALLIALAVIILFIGHLAWILSVEYVDITAISTYIHILVQAYLYTGLFITAHDSMHGATSRNRKINNAIGQVALWLFAAFRYPSMFSKHMAHHRNPGTEKDPDFYVKSQNPIRWFFHFFFNYITVVQIFTMAALFNVGRYLLDIPITNLIFYWVIPAFLATFQLFYFGTYRPHRLPHTLEMEPHRARTQRKNHLWALLSCWFFGYHWEHHEYPRTPWWQLYTKKDSQA